MSCRPWLPARPPSRPPSCHLRTDRSSGFPDQQLLTLSVWGLCVCVSLCEYVSVYVGVCVQQAQQARWPLWFGLRELVSRQWLWQPARATIPGGWEGCRRDRLDLLVQWRLWRKRSLRPAFQDPKPLPHCHPEARRRARSSVGKGQMSVQGPASLPLYLSDGGTAPSLMGDKRPSQTPLGSQI